MLKPRVRSFPLVVVAVFVALSLLTFGWAQGRQDRDRSRDDSSSAQRQAAPADRSRPSESRARDDRGRSQRAPETPPQRGREPQVSPPSRPQSPSSYSPGGRTQTPYSTRSRYGDTGQRSRSEYQNPYTRYRTQPQDNRGRQANDYGGDRSYRAQPRSWRDQGQEQPTAPSRRSYRTQPYSPRTDDASAASGPREGRSTNPYDAYARRRPRQQADDEAVPETRPSDRPASPYTRRQPRQTDDQVVPDTHARGRRSTERSVQQPTVRRDQPAPATRRERPAPERTDRGGFAPGQRTRAMPQAETRPAPRQGLRTSVPEARFRGSQAAREVRTIDPRQQERSRAELHDQIRQWNRTKPVLQQGRLVRDVIGNPVPRDARFIQRSRITRINTNYTHITTQFGTPRNYFVFMPRYRNDYRDGYWDGYRDGWWDGRAHRPHRPAVVINFFYGFYWSDPDWFGFYYPGYYPSVYHYWGWCPGWVYPTRVYVDPVDYVYVPPATPYRYYTPGDYVDQRGADRAIGDIRRSWLDGDLGLLSRHLTDQLDIQVYFDGEYNYTTSTDDYYGMTADAMSTTQTVAMDFDDPIWISPAEVFYTGRHVFYDPDGNEQTVYISYRMRHLGGEWYIVAIGSSLNPIEHHYHDFRYN